MKLSTVGLRNGSLFDPCNQILTMAGDVLYCSPMADTIATIPLSMDQAGVLRVGDTRVSLDSVIYAFQGGATPEEIVQQFTTLDLADVYSVIGYYLQNAAEVEEYLQRRTAERAELKKEIEARFDPSGIRDRLLARRRVA